MSRVKSLVRFELNITLANKLVLVYTLLFPMIFYFINQNRYSKNNAMLVGFWAYIIVTGTLSGVIAGTISMRETNFLKMFSYIAKSKQIVFLANLILQTGLLELELLGFNLFVFWVNQSIDILSLLYCGLISLILVPLCAGMLSFFLVMPMRDSTFNVLLNAYLLLMITVAFMKFPTPLGNLIILVDPFSYFASLYHLILNANTNLFDFWPLLLIGAVYTLLGFVCIGRMPISGNTTRY